MRSSVLTTLLVGLALSACKPPPEAPEDFTEVGLFLFEFFTDDADVLADGVRNMEAWLAANLDVEKTTKDQETIRDGYTVRNFDIALLATVRDDIEPEAEGSVAGSAVATESTFGVDPIALALALDEQEEVFPQTIETHERTFLAGESCFADRSCELLDTDNLVLNNLGTPPFDITVDSHSRSQYRWVQYGTSEDPKWAMLNRTWLQEEPTIGGTLGPVVAIHEQMYLRVVLPWADGSLTVGNTWVDATLTDLNEGFALRQMVKGMQSQGEALDKYLAGAN